MSAAERAAILRAAAEEGIPPSLALAIADRESGFNPRARNSKTIRGMYQMKGDLRSKYGVGDSDDPYAQAKGWGAFIKDVKKEMAGPLGRDPSDTETYLGHHFGGVRAGRMLGMDPNTPVDTVFTPREMRENPHFAKAGTVGALNSSIMADIGRRQAKFGAEVPDFASFGEPVETASAGPAISPAVTGGPGPDFSSFGQLAEQPQPSAQQPSSAPDLSMFGTPA
jgi:hypothetical protein